MPKRYKQQMNIGGKECWVTGKTLKELLEGYLQLCLQEGTVMPGIIRHIEKPKPKAPLVTAQGLIHGTARKRPRSVHTPKFLPIFSQYEHL